MDEQTSRVAVAFREGTLNIWRKDRWALQVFVPNIRFKYRELMFDADTAFRINLHEKAVGFRLLGFGLGFTRSPQLYRPYRNRGTCVHDVSLNRQCPECAPAMEVAQRGAKKFRNALRELSKYE